jgi:hypothetical protein
MSLPTAARRRRPPSRVFLHKFFYLSARRLPGARRQGPLRSSHTLVGGGVREGRLLHLLVGDVPALGTSSLRARRRPRRRRRTASPLLAEEHVLLLASTPHMLAGDGLSRASKRDTSCLASRARRCMPLPPRRGVCCCTLAGGPLLSCLKTWRSSVFPVWGSSISPVQLPAV